MPDAGGDDRTLLVRVRAGDDEAFTELYERHVGPVRRLAWALTRNAAEAEDLVAEAFFRVLRVVRRGSGPTDNARPYLLTVARRVAGEWSTSRHSEIPVEDVALTGNVALADEEGPARVEVEMLARAFRSLPPRWQRVLWHVEVEGSGPSSVAPMLGLTPNATAQLAHRAREGLRAAYVQAHLREEERPLDCQPVVEKLGAYAVGRLRRRDAARVRAHLAWCPSCRNLHDELDEVSAALRADLGILLAAAGVLVGFSGRAAVTVGALASGATSGAASGTGMAAASSTAAAGSAAAGSAVPAAAATSAGMTSAAVAAGGVSGMKGLVVAASVAAVGLFGIGPGQEPSHGGLAGSAGCAVACPTTAAQGAGALGAGSAGSGSSEANASDEEPSGHGGKPRSEGRHGSDQKATGSDQPGQPDDGDSQSGNAGGRSGKKDNNGSADNGGGGGAGRDVSARPPGGDRSGRRGGRDQGKPANDRPGHGKDGKHGNGGRGHGHGGHGNHGPPKRSPHAS